MIQIMNDQFSKELEPMKNYQTEMEEIKYSTESMGSQSHSSENSVRTRKQS